MSNSNLIKELLGFVTEMEESIPMIARTERGDTLVLERLENSSRVRNILMRHDVPVPPMDEKLVAKIRARARWGKS